jgi:hypothetical protein
MLCVYLFFPSLIYCTTTVADFLEGKKYRLFMVTEDDLAILGQQELTVEEYSDGTFRYKGYFADFPEIMLARMYPCNRLGIVEVSPGGVFFVSTSIK